MQTERTRNLLKTGFGLLLAIFTIFLAGAATARAQGLLYVLNQQHLGENQIHGFRVNETTGALSALAGFPLGTGGNGVNSWSPSEQMAIDAINGRLYVLNDSSDTISAYAINPATGALTALPFSPINLGSGAWTTLAVHPSGSPLVAGSGPFLNGRLHSFQITATTATTAAGSPYNTYPYNYAINAEPFSTAFSRDGNYVYTGGNFALNFAVFSVNAATGVLTTLAGSPFYSGNGTPRAYATDSAGRLFLANSQVHVFTTNTGIPSAVSGNPFPSGLTSATHGVLHPNGFYLVADRSGNRVGVYQISGSGAATTLAAVAGSPFAAGGTFTNVLALNQSGAFLFAVNGSSRNLTTFGVNPTTGVLTALDTQPANTLGAGGILSGMGYYPVSTTPGNTAPGITAQPGISRQRGSAGDNSTIALVSDAETAAGSLTVTITSANPANGVTVNNLSVDSSGMVTADVAASCTATTSTFTLQATDSGNLTATAMLTVTVGPENTPPVITLNGANPLTIECALGFNDPGATAIDNCSGSRPVTATHNINGNVPGSYLITYQASDVAGNVATKTRTVIVVDSVAPQLTLRANLSLWPPDHMYRTITMSQMVQSVVDGCNNTLSIGNVLIEKVTSDEPDDVAGDNDGITTNDILIAADCKSVRLRAERDLTLNGRVYVVTLRVRDASGNTTRRDFKVSVPISQNGKAAVQGATTLTKTSVCP